MKYAGGKAELLPELRARLPREFGRYYEPFCGGAALFFDLAERRTGAEHVIADANEDLIAMYRALADDTDRVIGVLSRHAREHSKAHYATVRRLFNGNRGWSSESTRAAEFIYLNKTCFNGLWRVNKAGEFNVPMGRTSSGTPPLICDEQALRAAAAVLLDADIRQGGYDETLYDVEAGDLVYFDPPYVPVSASASFTAYQAGGFGEKQQRELASYVRGLSARGVHCLVSNSGTPLVHELYAGFRIDTVRCGRSINSKGGRRGKVDEVIVVAPGVGAE